jgi:hypothetical protein
VVGLLTEIIWSDALPGVGGSAPGAPVGGGDGLEPSVGAGRVPGLAVLGSPGAPLPAGEVAALVARLNAVLAAERGADIVAVWTAGAASQVGLPAARAAVPAA